MGRTDVQADGAGSRSDESGAHDEERGASVDEDSAASDERSASADGAHGSESGATTPADESFSEPIERALAAFRAGEPVCVHDFDDREGETDLFYPATAVDAAAVTRLRTDAGGLVCVALDDAVAGAADLPLFADAVEHPAVETTDLAYGDRSSFSLTVNHRDTYTGVTDADRALTIAELGEFAAAVADDDLADPTAAFADEFRVPGHVHLLRGASGGLSERRGHTELALALARAAGVAPAVVVCEMLDDDSGEALSVDDAREYASRRDVPFLEGERIVDELE